MRGHVDRNRHHVRPALRLGQRCVHYIVLATGPGCGARPELDSAATDRTSEGPRPAVERTPGGRAGGGTAGPGGPGGPGDELLATAGGYFENRAPTSYPPPHMILKR